MFAKAGNNNSIQASLIRRISAAVLSAACLAMLTVACSRSSGITLNYSDHDPLGGMRTQFVKDVLLAGIVEQGGLIWMPAHLASDTAASAHRSDGSPVSLLDSCRRCG